MATAIKKQTQKRGAFFVDAQTHQNVTTYAAMQRRGIKVVVTDLINSNPKMQRFLNKDTTAGQRSEKQSPTNS